MVYIVSVVSVEQHELPKQTIVGSYVSLVDAAKSLDEELNRQLDKIGKQEMGVYDYYNEGEDFYIEGADMEYHIIGKIIESELTK